jgi:hypothetical protein
MKATLKCCLFLSFAAVTYAQQAAKPAVHPSHPAAAKPALRKHIGAIGFTYSLPAEWTVVDMSSSLQAERQKAQAEDASEEEKHGVGCIEIALTAHHGNPGSMITAVDLPTACMGVEMSPSDLPGFGRGASQGIQQGFDPGEPTEFNYTLGHHAMWMARFSATPKGSTAPVFTVETVCTLVKKGAVCWMVLAANSDALNTFERGPVVLDSDLPSPLVPRSVFVKEQN